MKKILIVISAVLLSACTSVEDTNATPGPQKGGATQVEARVIQVKASRFEFKPSVIRIKKGESVRFEVENEDTRHDFYIPDLNLTSGDVFVSEKVGTFEFRCANFCGSGHNSMAGQIIVVE